MRFDCGETIEERSKRLEEWHLWFAWYPVRVGPHDCRWLEYVERRMTFFSWGVCGEWLQEYRAVDAPPDAKTPARQG